MWDEQERRLVADMQREIRDLRGRIAELEGKESSPVLWLAARGADEPADPTTHCYGVIWVDDGGGAGGKGDLMYKVYETIGGLKTGTIMDYSAM